MTKTLLLFICMFFLFGCTIGSKTPEIPENLISCSGSLLVSAGPTADVAGVDVTINPIVRRFDFSSWDGQTCTPSINEKKTVRKYINGKSRSVYEFHLLPNDPNCYYTKDEFSSRGVNETLVLLLSRCGISKSASVWIGTGSIADIQFPQYQTN